MLMLVACVQLANGQIVEVPPALIKRQKQHFTTLEGTGTCFTETAACEASAAHHNAALQTLFTV